MAAIGGVPRRTNGGSRAPLQANAVWRVYLSRKRGQGRACSPTSGVQLARAAALLHHASTSSVRSNVLRYIAITLDWHVARRAPPPSHGAPATPFRSPRRTSRHRRATPADPGCPDYVRYARHRRWCWSLAAAGSRSSSPAPRPGTGAARQPPLKTGAKPPAPAVRAKSGRASCRCLA